MTDVVRTTFSGGPAGDWLTVFRIDRLLGGTAQDSVDTVTSFWNEGKTMLSQAITAHVSGVVEVCDPITGQPTGIDTATPANVAFTMTGDPLPWQTQLCIYWNTGTWIGGRQVRGRTFVPAQVETYNDVNGLPASGLVAVVGLMAAHISNSSTTTPGIYSRKHHNTYPVTSHQVSTKWSVMRTRR